MGHHGHIATLHVQSAIALYSFYFEQMPTTQSSPLLKMASHFEVFAYDIVSYTVDIFKRLCFFFNQMLIMFLLSEVLIVLQKE
jgi:hypothetical protein